jgi:hypothetical protein
MNEGAPVFQPDVADLSWRKSSFSNGNGCVEAAPMNNGLIAVRDSKNPQAGHQVYNALEWRAFLAGVRNGEFDHLAPVSPSTEGLV